ncbi:MAG TPA: SMP-30/gluconolactonase/LRE family protein [Caulobacteraceae bacterium]
MAPATNVGIEVVLDAGAIIGESPTWSAGERALYWIDVKKPALHRYDPDAGAQRSWTLSSDVGGFALTAGPPGALVALRDGVFGLDFASGVLERLAPPPFDPSLFRFNEGACDSAGRFWIGVMFDPLEASAEPRKGALHSFRLESGLRLEADAAELHNGMAWSIDGRTFYLSHSNSGEIFAHTFNATSGRFGEGRIFAQLAPALGIPDGAAVDTEGGYWSACHGGGRLRRYRADGTVDRDILLPVSQPTMCAFAGENLEVMYVTTARDKLGPKQLAREPLAGALLRLRPGERGIPRPCIVR